jgi:hypothetical protein
VDVVCSRPALCTEVDYVSPADPFAPVISEAPLSQTIGVQTTAAYMKPPEEWKVVKIGSQMAFEVGTICGEM